MRNNNALLLKAFHKKVWLQAVTALMILTRHRLHLFLVAGEGLH